MSAIFAPPEASPVIDYNSLQGYRQPTPSEDDLRHADPDWVLTLLRGVQTKLLSLVVMFIAIATAAILRNTLDPLSRAVLTNIGSFVMTVGAWMLTEPDPSRRGEATYGLARKIVRITLCVGAFGMFVQFIPAVAPMTAEAKMLVGFAMMLAGLTQAFGQLSFLRYISKLALRIPDLTIHHRARSLVTGLLAAYVGIFAMLLGAGTAVVMGVHGMVVVGGIGVLLCFGVLAVLGLMSLYLQVRLMIALGNQVELSRVRRERQPAMAA